MTASPYIAVVGGVNIDIGGRSDAPLVAGDSNPGRIRSSLGGVGRNIAHNLALLGAKVKLITLTNYEAVLDVALKTGYITENHVGMLNEWRANPSQWQG